MTVGPLDCIADAIDVIQGDHDRGVVVVDSLGHVLGILTEGDIVRVLRQGILPEALVAEVTTGKIKLVTTPLTDEELVREFVSQGTLLVPVVDEFRRFLYLQRSREAVRRLFDIVTVSNRK